MDFFIEEKLLMIMFRFLKIWNFLVKRNLF